MSGYGSDTDNQPLRYWNGRAIYLTLYLAMGVAAAIIVILLLDAARVAPAGALAFHPSAVRRGMLWQVVSWPLVNPMEFFTPFNVLCFYWFGVEVEKYLGRKKLLGLLGVLVFVPVLYLSAFLIFGGLSGALSGLYIITAALLIAFATLYPDTEMFGWVPLKYFAFVCIACGAITYFPDRDWAGLALLLLECLVAFLFVKHARGHLEFNFNLRRFWPRKKPKLRVVPRGETTRASRRPSAAIADEVDAAEAEINALLDKIASTGLQSLSGSEKARLETLRQQMLRKGS